jgi:hypothetical protein
MEAVETAFASSIYYFVNVEAFTSPVHYFGRRETRPAAIIQPSSES